MKKIILLVSILFISACSSSDSDSGGMVEATLPGTSIPANFVGTYKGTLNVTVSALGLSERDSFPITVTVSSDGMIRFDGDEPDETFTAGLSNSGTFSGNLPISDDDCSATLSTVGMVDGTTASGTVSGDGQCTIDRVTVDVRLEGDFNATK